MEILESADQLRFDQMMLILRQLDIDLKEISTAPIREKFTAAMALIFNNAEQAAVSLSQVYNISDSVEAEVLLYKLSSTINSLLAEDLKIAFSKLGECAANVPSTIRIPSRLMPHLLGISADKWEHVKHDSNAKQWCPFHGPHQPYSLSELSEIRKGIKNSEVVRDAKQKLAIEIQKGVYYNKQEIARKLAIGAVHMSFLLNHDVLGTREILNGKLFILKSTVDDFAETHTKTTELAKALKTSIHSIQLAITELSIYYHTFAEWPRTPFFIENIHIPAIDKIVAKRPTLKRSLGTFRSRRICTSTSTPFIPIAKAVKLLNIHPATVRYYRDLGLISHLENNIGLLSRNDILRFHERYATPSDLGSELCVSSKMITRILHRAGISPIAGPSMTGTASWIYDRSTLPTDLAYRINPKNDNFGKYWLQKEILNTTDAANTLGISVGDTSRLIKLAIKPNRAPCYRHYLGVSKEELSKLIALLKSLIPLSHFLNTRDMTYFGFHRRFAYPKYVQLIKISGINYLTQQDFEKLNLFLAEYCSPGEGDRMLAAPRNTLDKMIARNKIQAYFVPNYFYKHPVLRICDVEKIAQQRRTFT